MFVNPSGDNKVKYLLFFQSCQICHKMARQMPKTKAGHSVTHWDTQLQLTRPPIELIHVFVTQSHDL